jgi:hypothetical protein
MQKLLSALVVLAALAGAVGSAQAATFGSTDYWIERDRNMN